MPYNADADALVPVNLARVGYDEREYFLSGRANVYDWRPDGNFASEVLRSGDYTTRIVVRQPASSSQWSGAVVVEIVNMTGFGPTLGFDYEGVWANNWREITRRGMAYVGITSKPNVFDALRRFDAQRYAPLNMANPLPAEEQVCGKLPGSNGYNPNRSKLYENGLIFDALSQLGALLHSDSDRNPLGAPAQLVYLTGLSQSAAYLKTYLRFIAPRATLPNGMPIFNGYRTEGAVTDPLLTEPYGADIALNQCATPLPLGDPQLSIPDRGVPVIELHASADLLFDMPLQDDSLLYRLWEVAGAFHDNTWTFQYGYPRLSILARVLPGVSQDLLPRCAESYPPDPSYQDIYDSSLRALDEWVRFGIPAPHVDRIKLVAGRQLLDKAGNPEGGLRLPAVEVPAATFHTDMFEPKPDCSHRTRLHGADLKARYPNHSAYVAAVASALERLVTAHLLTSEDAFDELLSAVRSDVP